MIGKIARILSGGGIRIAKLLSMPFRYWCFYLFFAISVVDNLLGLKQLQIGNWLGVQPTVTLMVIGLSVLVCYCETFCTILLHKAITHFFPRFSLKYNPGVYLFASVNLALLIANVFVVINFGRAFDTGMLDIISQTNTNESREFLNTYLSFGSVSAILAIIAVVFFLAWLLYKLSRRYERCCLAVYIAFLLWSLFVSGVVMYKFVLYRNAQNIPQANSITRVSYYAFLITRERKGFDNLCEIAKRYNKGTKSVGPTYVLVIGESHSKFHSSLYGYGKETNPLLKKYCDDGSLVLFDDAVTISDHTSAVMNSIFSLGRYNNDLYSMPLLPMIFKGQGFYTAMYDNQYFVGDGQGILTYKPLSEEMFDYRNDSGYRYDGDMVADVSLPQDCKTLLIIHLYGQHYTYTERFPKSFTYFKPNEYSGTEKERIAKADYDNACRYNDCVLNAIIEKFKDKEACVVYLSDHGEDVYDQPDVMGHGNAAYVPTLKYQMRVPMFVWGSDSFIESNGELWSRIRKAAILPVSTDDISHFLIDMAGLEVDELDKSRSALSPEYDVARPRMMLESIAYTKDK